MSEDGFSDPYDEPLMDLCIETLTGTSFDMRVYPSDTVLDIKNKIQRVEGIPVHHQNLLFRLKELEDHKRLCDVGIVNGSTLKLVLSMRGGPISTRRLSPCEHHINWKDLKELIEHTREEISDKLGPGAKVSVLVFKDGDVINLVRVIENDEGGSSSGSDKPVSSTPGKMSSKDGSRVFFYNRIQENNTMLTKLTDLRKKMADLNLKRHLKNSKPIELDAAESDENNYIGYVGQKLAKSGLDIEDDSDEKELDLVADELNDLNRPSSSSSSISQNIKYNLALQFIEDCSENLRSQIDSLEFEDNFDSSYKNVSAAEDSIALKEKHRGKSKKSSTVFKATSEPRLQPEKSKIPEFFNSKHFDESFPSSVFLKALKEGSYRHENVPHHGFLKTIQPSTAYANATPVKTHDEKIISGSILSPLYNRFTPEGVNSRNARTHNKSDNNVNVSCDCTLSSSSTASSIAESIAIIEEDEADDDNKVLSPIGVPCVETLSMSKHSRLCLTPLLLQESTERPNATPDKLEVEETAQEICDIFAREPFAPEPAEKFRTSPTCKIGFLKRRQSLDSTSASSGNFNSISSKGNMNFEAEEHEISKISNLEPIHKNVYLPTLYSSYLSQYSSPEERVGDVYFGNRVNDRAPLYKRSNSFTNSTTSDSALATGISNKTGDILKNLGISSGMEHLRLVSNAENNVSVKENCDKSKISSSVLNSNFGQQDGIFGSSRYTRNESFRPFQLRPLRLPDAHHGSGNKISKEIKKLCSTDMEERNSARKIEVTTTKLENLPAVVDRKRIRCGQCNKRLNITNMYDCRCGGIYCAQHRYSEVHGCKYDYKTEGRKLLEQQNPLVVADKLPKF